MSISSSPEPVPDGSHFPAFQPGMVTYALVLSSFMQMQFGAAAVPFGGREPTLMCFTSVAPVALRVYRDTVPPSVWLATRSVSGCAAYTPRTMVNPVMFANEVSRSPASVILCTPPHCEWGSTGVPSSHPGDILPTKYPSATAVTLSGRYDHGITVLGVPDVTVALTVVAARISRRGCITRYIVTERVREEKRKYCVDCCEVSNYEKKV
mmetsp:Transcript_32876/g.37412  ORF Transcript_32876/g.37412 Transcript_32876/m.37412 type:complete len:209 (-) Transcript_32876:3-629(-)